MDRFSSLITEELLKDTDLQETENRFETQKEMEQLQTRAAIILGILVNSKDFTQTFLYTNSEDLHVYSHYSKRMVIIDALTRCAPDQMVNYDTYKFTAHPNFEKKISAYTRTLDKPNQPLSKNRPWDVALSIIIKVEALDHTSENLTSSRLLLREYSILKHIWESYVRELIDLDEMTGIPMVFDYTDVPNSVFNYEPNEEHQQKFVDPYGCLMPWKSEFRSTMAYMTMEKLGPNVHYLLELMVRTRRKTCTFDLDTAFKIFDQIICRCLQLHKFGVVHNAVEPRNTYFGRSSSFNVVYLANFGKAMITDSKERKMADVLLGGNPRFTSQYRLRGTYPNPMQDIESAFYTLLSMIVHNLPWDVFLQSNVTPRQSDLNANTSNQSDLEGVDPHPKVRENKFSFWKHPAGINRVLADVQYLAVGSDFYHVNLATEIIKDIYTKLRDQFQQTTYKVKPKTSIAGNLLSQQSAEFQFYFEIRRATLLFFRFESLSVSLCTTTYQKKIEAISRDEQEPRPAWNLSNWCFNVVQMNAPGNMRLSMVPLSMVARTNE
ncbi:hypothetical protein BOX15_Mlig014736g2 [Macrostomum lignano]|uniref:Protein kinase domain-containing protein n=1 Tax=Macrostomum lignano TaxID=282301 RepID=A0A267DMD5_9PLAT|nr:hypothetical protein BOX15_Mlig014736g1 [Macrostomum lignano]PAA75594.1 hypothetical protein BOX15_Mlig014736g2 [Macrostomum lignano]